MRQRPGSKSAGLRAAAVLMALGALAGAFATALPASATGSFTFTREAGSDRYGTAAALAEAAFPSGAATVLMATGLNFPDALAGSYLAGNESGGAPILLTDPNSVPSDTLSALSTLQTKNVIILGGTSAVSQAVQDQLAGTSSTSSQGGNLNVTRIAGATRYDTMEMIDSQSGADTVGVSGGKNTAIIATGDNFPDALSAGPIAYADHFPLVLTDGSAASLSPQAVTVLDNDAIKLAIVVGGSSAIDPAQVNQLKSMGITVDQQAGADRSATSEDLANDAVANYGFSAASMDVANGNDTSATGGGGVPAGFTPDALALAPLGGVNKFPTLITLSPTDAGSASAYASANSSKLTTAGYAAGGTSAIADSTLSTIASAAGGAYPNSGYSVSAAASPSSVPSNGSATSTITVTVDNASGQPVAGDPVALSYGTPSSPEQQSSATNATPCGSLSSTTGTTGSNGTASFTYTASSTAGSCTITAQEAAQGVSNQVQIVQTSLWQDYMNVSPTTMLDTTGTSSVKVLVAMCATSCPNNPYSPAPNTTPTFNFANGDTVTFGTSPVLGTSCGSYKNVTSSTGYSTASNGSAGTTTGTAGSSAQPPGASATYTAGGGPGFCYLTATDTSEQGGGQALVDQTQNPNPGTYTMTASASPTTVSSSNGQTSTVTVTVMDGSLPVQGDQVHFAGASSGSCGGASPSFATTNGAGTATFTFTPADAAASCALTFVEADQAVSNSQAVVDQTTTAGFTMSSNPTSIPADGKSTSTITATAINTQTGAPESGEHVSFSTSGDCGSLSATTGATNGSGQVSVTYTSSTTIGFCTITGQDLGASDPATGGTTGLSASTQVDQRTST